MGRLWRTREAGSGAQPLAAAGILRLGRAWRNQLAGRSDRRDPFDPLGDERPRCDEDRADHRRRGGGTFRRAARYAPAIERIARVASIGHAENAPRGSAQIVIGGATFALPLAGVIDFDAEEARLEKEVARLQGEIVRIDKKLANESFVSRAPEDVVDAEREKRAGYAADSERLRAALKRVKEAA